MSYEPLKNLIDEFSKLPGVGRKSATRMAFYILERDIEEVKNFSEVLVETKEKVKKCKICGNFTEEEICYICDSELREKDIICVVEDVRDIIAMEKLKSYKGLYHVLGGKLAPLNGIGPNDLNLKSLVERVARSEFKEVILALNTDLEGETTSMYIAKLLRNFDVELSKIASGIPMGGNLEFSDMATIAKSLEGRRKI